MEIKPNSPEHEKGRGEDVERLYHPGGSYSMEEGVDIDIDTTYLLKGKEVQTSPFEYAQYELCTLCKVETSDEEKEMYYCSLRPIKAYHSVGCTASEWIHCALRKMCELPMAYQKVG